MSSSNTPFVLPTGAVVDTTDGSLSISYDGDIILEQSASLPLGRIEAGGDILLRMDNVQGTIIAGGRLIINGNVDAEWLHGSEIHISRRVFQESKVRAKYITALKRIVICDTTLTTEMVLAPKLEISKKSKGIANVIDCNHKIDLPSIKGKLRLVEHERAFGNIDAIIESHGLHAFFSHKTGVRFLSQAKGEHYEPIVEIQTDYADISNADKGVDDDYFDDTGIDATGVSESFQEEAPQNPFFARGDATSNNIDTDDTGISVVQDSHSNTLENSEGSLSIPKSSRQESPSENTDKLVVIERNPNQKSTSDTTVHSKLAGHLDGLLAIYPSPPPPPIELVKHYIHTDNILLLQQELTTIWRQLVSWHKTTNTPPNKQAAKLFKEINTTLRRS